MKKLSLILFFLAFFLIIDLVFALKPTTIDLDDYSSTDEKWYSDPVTKTFDKGYWTLKVKLTKNHGLMWVGFGTPDETIVTPYYYDPYVGVNKIKVWVNHPITLNNDKLWAVIWQYSPGGSFEMEGTPSIEICEGCIIDGVCYAPDQLKPDNPCYYCDPEYNPAEWRKKNSGDSCDTNKECMCTDTGFRCVEKNIYCCDDSDCVDVGKLCGENYRCEDICSDKTDGTIPYDRYARHSHINYVCCNGKAFDGHCCLDPPDAGCSPGYTCSGTFPSCQGPATECSTKGGECRLSDCIWKTKEGIEMDWDCGNINYKCCVWSTLV